MKNLKAKIWAWICLIFIGGSAVAGVIMIDQDQAPNIESIVFSDGSIKYTVPEYNGDPYISLKSDPVFNEFELEEVPYEEYSSLDKLGRATMASAICCIETMPKKGEKRGSISSVKPTGWVQAQYDCVSGKSLYNRCHLIGWQLTAENANKRNLITGTRYLNIDGMLGFEDMVAQYIKSTGGYVAYQVTPIYIGDNLVASGVQMEGYSIGDDGQSISFNVFCYNVQPGIFIDYATGNSHLIEDINMALALFYINWKKM